MKHLGLFTILCLGLAACQPTDAEQEEVGGFSSQMSVMDSQRAACEARGGRWGTGGVAGFMTCIETPRDAGKSCERSTDCSTNMCLARSKSCSPISPLFGCNEVLDAAGRRVTLCVD
ncbi:hypothetical protein [Celeribacter litoreus]|uniref:hypothetical protein n=1 Tax=Celeribacter litoreus TaxID=2876714 RepID=UPI001CCE68D3|nr:hypothetical protein [Celeribacter litoreus]MCA0045143.1 hypothetical protein [Celeribacter litoreus]